mmetsp:Transcript_5119/g.7078  ORF Transcript_5119/g.7078 Transcript_5119/m.7078 type:complete len:357 (-) Transcript_5119:246-1316(-)
MQGLEKKLFLKLLSLFFCAFHLDFALAGLIWEVEDGSSSALLRIIFEGNSAGEKVKVKADDIILRGSNLKIISSFKQLSSTNVLSKLSRYFQDGPGTLNSVIYSTKGKKSEVLIAPPYLTDVAVVDLSEQDEGLIINKGHLLAADDSVQVTKNSGDDKVSRWFRNVEKEQHGNDLCSGEGILALSGFGAITEYHLKKGKILDVNTGHLLAFGENSKPTVVEQDGIASLRFTGPCQLFVQSQSPKKFRRWANLQPIKIPQTVMKNPQKGNHISVSKGGPLKVIKMFFVKIFSRILLVCSIIVTHQILQTLVLDGPSGIANVPLNLLRFVTGLKDLLEKFIIVLKKVISDDAWTKANE